MENRYRVYANILGHVLGAGVALLTIFVEGIVWRWIWEQLFVSVFGAPEVTVLQATLMVTVVVILVNVARKISS